jgi:Flp pilus assembly protein TadD
MESLRQKDPLSAFVRTECAHLLFLLRRYDETAKVAQQALDLAPNHIMAMFQLIGARTEQGRTDEAIRVAEHAVKLSPQWLVCLTYLALAYARGNRLDEARRVLAEMHVVAGQGHTNATAFACGYLAIGDFDRCFDWLNRAIDQREPIIVTLKNWSLFDPLHPDPRYPALLRRMNLEN